MNDPIVHVVSSNANVVDLIEAVSQRLEPNVCVSKYASPELFDAQNHSAVPSYQVIVSDLPTVKLPAVLANKYIPIVHLGMELQLLMPNSGAVESAENALMMEIEQRLKEAIEKAKLYNSLRSRVDRFSILNAREKSVVALASEGVPNKTIAKRLNVSIKTIEHCRRKAYTKLGVSSAAEVARLVTFKNFFSIWEDQVAYSDSSVFV